jgi:ATP-dependent RNA/DNA helicase IGHMBP2
MLISCRNFVGMDYFQELQDLLKIEKDEDLSQYQQLTESVPIQVRSENGLTWYPVAIRNTELTRGDYISVEVERTTHHLVSSQFRFGSAVALFSNHNPADKIEGVVTHISGNKCKITFRVDELPAWCRDGKLGLDQLFDNNSYNEMAAALKQAAELAGSKNPSTGNLIPLFTGNSKPQFETQAYTYEVDGLNRLQQLAVNKILAAQELAIVHGPPGTGKTTTLVQAIKALLKKDDKQILVVAPSNTAVDLLTEKLAALNINVLRIGNPSRVSTTLQAMTLDSKMAAHDGMKEIRSLKKQAAEFKNMAHKYKRNFGRAEQEQRKALFSEAFKIMKEVDLIEKYISDQVISSAKVITATLVGANHYTIKGLRFETVVIDEAGQAIEPACWIPILKAAKVIFAGDHCQLPPTIKSTEAARKGLSVTLMEKAVKKFPEAVILLEEQYRMHNDIMGYSSQVFYRNALVANAAVATSTFFKEDLPFVFIDTSGCGFEEKNEDKRISNLEEAHFLLNHLNEYLKRLRHHLTIDQIPTIGVISPYQEQVKSIVPLCSDYDEVMRHMNYITLNTIDSFQGQEKDIIYISLTRSNMERNIGFLADIRRMNVAMTRAKKKLVIIGDGTTLTKHGFYKELIDYAERKQAYFSAWEFL